MGVSATGAAVGLSGCMNVGQDALASAQTPARTPAQPVSDSEWHWSRPNSVRHFEREDVVYYTAEPAGTIVIDPSSHFLYLVLGPGRARRYGIGVGSEGYGWSGVATVHSKQEWPDWYPTKDILARMPQLRPRMKKLTGGDGFAGGEENPLGARALYLWQNNKDTLYRIHGTNEPWTIGQNVSSGCIRLTNDDVIDLYSRTPVGTKVVVL